MSQFDIFTCSNNAEQCIHGKQIIVGNYIYFGTESFRSGVFIAKLWKVNINNFLDAVSITFPANSTHKGCSDLQYSKNNDRLYVAFRNSGYIAEVNPYTFSGYSDVITNATCLGGTAIWIEGDYLYEVGHCVPTKLYKYDLRNYSLSASNLTISPGWGHGLTVSGDYIYVVNGCYGASTTVWKFNKFNLNQVAVKTYVDMIGGSHDITVVNNAAIFFGLHGYNVAGEACVFTRINTNNFNYYNHITMPPHITGAIMGSVYSGRRIWLTHVGTPSSIIRVNPHSLGYSIHRFPDTYPGMEDAFCYSQGAVTFDDQGRVFNSFMPDFRNEKLNVPAYLCRHAI